MHMTPTQQSLYEARKARMARMVGAGIEQRPQRPKFVPVLVKKAEPPPPPPPQPEYKPLNFLKIEGGTEPTIHQILRTVAKHYHVSVFELTCNRRPARIVLPRQVAAYLACELTQRSLPHIGRLINRDHTTVLYSRNKIATQLSMDPELHADVEAIKAALRAEG